jgi:chromosome segregation ATPase
MLKNALPWILLAVVLVVVAFILGSNANKEEIARVEAQMRDMKSQRDSIGAFVAFKDSMQHILQKRITELETDADNLRDQVKILETARKKEQLAVRMLKTPDDLKNKFAQTFPELPEEKIKIFEEYVSEVDISVQYLGVPLWFSETFIIDHNNSISYKKQKGKLETLDSLNLKVISLHETVLVLEKEKSEAYRVGYDSAYTHYMEISKLYINELEKPRFELPHWGAIIGGAAAGILIGTQLK